ncbi:zinc ABC transporter substrate-binding protein [Phototrophicus methaneseepsis]|uniref:Zinc ABC transporter substrate-binding protein n=1 Tax=Phototrophicus methaneseepsis TaxID=2710758 RepID=A0A7S8EC64_9CHLR|nr:zinc ABC transporter substrate-binding protein [Phototrophicus methaneseepsis]QPC84154.1 zinc ABC transporter substrate-binding protein [Phototrophicus methaneseepsis]
MKPQRLAVLIVLLFFLVMGNPSFGRATAQDESLNIVATTTQAYDLMTILADGVEGVNITGLMGAGVDPHLYQPTESDIAAMSDANMVIYSGLHLEGQFDTVFQALGERGVTTFALAQPVKDAGFIIGGFTLSEELTNVDDPHFWFDPRNWEMSAEALAAELSEQDPEHADIYTANAEAYIEQLQAVYEWANEAMRTVPESQRYLVTSHDAFQYFGAAFGWRMFSIQGISTQDEAGVGDIQGVVDFVIENDIPVIFIESSLPPDTVEAVVAAVADEGHDLRLGVRELFSDAMGERDAFGGTYIGMLAENVYTILQSYECMGVEVSIPEWPEDLLPTPPEDLLTVECEAAA